MKKEQSIEIIKMLLLITLIQVIREGIEQIIYIFYSPSNFASKMITMSIMLILTLIFIGFTRILKTPLSVFPKHFSKGYIIFTVITALLLIVTPSNYTEGFPAIMSLIYGSIVTPIFEELIFRGFLWNRFEKIFKKDLTVFITTVIFFTVWHIGYMIPNIIDGNLNAVLWKLAAGLGYGTILGFIRLKTNNCYSTMLVHGLLNMVMI